MSLRRTSLRGGVLKTATDGGADLVRSSAGTLHRQIYGALVERINRGDVRPGDRMPTESELMQRYSVSRATARRALDDLRRDNIVERQPGRGTFVAQPRLQASIPHLHSITEEIQQLGYRPGSRILSRVEQRCDEATAKLLGIFRGDKVLKIERLRTADDEPFYFAESLLNATTFPKLLKVSYRQKSLSLYRVFEEATGRRVERAVQWLSAVPATPYVARQLGVPTGSPLLKLERVLYVAGDAAVEALSAWFLGESYKYYSELRA
jgi:GntR family transcriptional regulator